MICAGVESSAGRGDTRAGGQAGFSLLELLAVVFVIVLVTSMVGLSVGDGGNHARLEIQARELVETAEYALDEAQFTGLDYGLVVEEVLSPEGSVYRYSWLERRRDGWQEPVSGKEIFANREWPTGIAMELEIEESPFAEDEAEELEEEELEEGEEPRPPNPQIVMYSSGETTVGAINVRRLEDSELLWRIEWDLLGNFKMLLRGEDDFDEEPG